MCLNCGDRGKDGTQEKNMVSLKRAWDSAHKGPQCFSQRATCFNARLQVIFVALFSTTIVAIKLQFLNRLCNLDAQFRRECRRDIANLPGFSENEQ